MKLNMKEMTKETTPIFYVYDPYTGEQTIEYTNLTAYTDKEYEEKLKLIKKEQPKATLFDSLESAIDNLRFLDFIKNFDTTTITYYMEYLTSAVKFKTPLYVIRERKCHFAVDYYLDKSYLDLIKFAPLNGGKWRLRLRSMDKHIASTHNADSLGLTIFFDERNAKERLSKLKGGVN